MRQFEKLNNAKDKKKRKINKSLIFVILVLPLIILISNNWNGIKKYINSIKLSNPVTNKVIEDYNSDESPRLASGVDKTILIINESDDNSDKISSIFILTASEQKGLYLIQHIPGEVYMSLYSSDISDYVPISNLPYIGEKYEDGLGIEYSIWQIENLFATEFDSYIWIDHEATEILKTEFGYSKELSASKKYESIKQVGKLINQFLKLDEIGSLVENVSSNLDLSYIFKYMNKFVPEDGSQLMIDYSQTEYLQPYIHKNGSEIFLLKESAIDESINGILDQIISKDIEKEQAKIEIYNGSIIPGLASKYSRILQNNSLNVVRIGNSEDGYPVTTIYVPNKEKFLQTLSYVEVLIGMDNYEIVEERPIFLSTGDIVIVLGQDMSESSLPYVIY